MEAVFRDECRIRSWMKPSLPVELWPGAHKCHHLARGQQPWHFLRSRVWAAVPTVGPVSSKKVVHFSLDSHRHETAESESMEMRKLKSKVTPQFAPGHMDQELKPEAVFLYSS
ncbi:hypothetical protein H920_13170 [Fukomys damarensis]|uniref:Uncharacterized protein n=1 Tax=Fukomys damarensis TaxID=885580 RepID=A0A091CZZ4_FUKDA|nr:hypothetical protein H920_13170 [Fukomys damarensis]